MTASIPHDLQALRDGDLAGARELRLPGLDTFPREVFGLAETLEVLDLSGGKLTALPDDIGRLRRLRVLFCSGNRFERLPPSLGDCPALSQIGFRRTELREIPGEALPQALRWLILTDNQIERLPPALGKRPLLQKLMLAGNKIRALPESLADAQRLELVRLSSNRFETLPKWLAGLPALAWMSWAGNPLEDGLARSAAPLVPWKRLAVGERLGEGASGSVHRALWRGDDGEARAVALKIFKGAMTSDGLPAREIAACLAAGEHAHLTSALGQLVDHPEGADALLMPLLSDHWRALAGPPSPASCSRDIYDPELRFTRSAALRIARNVAAATAHLHARMLMHGDLYAHNILWDGEAGDCVLSDFGAACALPAGEEGDAWRRIEVRAFGLLLGELLDRDGPALPEADKIRALERACVQPETFARPMMTEVLETLEAAAAGA